MYTKGMNTPRAIGYIRVSTEEQARSGLGLDAQRNAITAAATTRGWHLVDVIVDAGVTGSKAHRPGLDTARERMARREADYLVVAKLDRLSRSIRDGADVIEQANRQGWSLVDLGSGVDMSTPAGEMVAGVLLSAAQYERRLIGQRTREGLAVARARGARIGQPTTYSDETLRRVKALKAEGMSLRGIAERLTNDGIPTAKGGAWHASSVRSVLNSRRMTELEG